MSFLSEWRTEIVGVLSAVGASLFTRLRYKRQASKTRLGEAEDSGGVFHIKSLREDRQSLQGERDGLLHMLNEMRDELAAAKIRGAARDMQIRAIKAHVLLVTRMFSEGQPRAAKELNESAFMTLFDDSTHSPKER